MIRILLLLTLFSLITYAQSNVTLQVLGSGGPEKAVINVPHQATSYG